MTHGHTPVGGGCSRSQGDKSKKMANKDLILVVDDEVDMRQMVCRALEREGFRSIEAGSGEEMRAAMEKHSIDLLLLDIMLPDTDGYTLAREIRKTSDLPIIMLTGRDDVVDKVAGLEIGADDYITKPFHPRELTARVKTILRRTQADDVANEGRAADASKASFVGWVLDMGAFKLQAPDGENVGLTSYEFQVLSVLVRNAKKILSRDQILDLVADREWNPYDRSIDVLIGKIRKKLRDDPVDPAFIKTVRGMGYMFVADVAFEE